MSQTLTIRVSDELRSQLDALARKEKLPVSEIVRESLEHHLAVRRFRALRRKVLPLAEARGLLTDEDVFKVVS